MTARTLSSATNQLIETYGNTAKNVINAYRIGNERVVGFMDQRWESALSRTGRKLTAEVRGNALSAQKKLSAYYTQGYTLATDSADVLVNKAVALAGKGIHQVAANAGQFEKKTGVIEGGDTLKVFDFDGVRAGIAICYDIEFPLPVRAQCEAGAHLLLVPSCTDTAAGATRVRVGCLARALENRCFVAKAVTAGEAEWSPALDINTGEATVYAPMDVGLPADGILVASGADAGWSYADIDVAQLDGSRAQAQVANDRDWRGQLAPSLLQAKLERCP